MTTNKFLTVTSGTPTLTQAPNTSAGAGDANKLISTNSSGKLDPTFLPPGIELQTITFPISETIANGAFVNIFSNSGTPTARNADATNNRPATGYVLTGSGGQPTGNVTVYLSGTNTSVTTPATNAGSNVYLAASGGFSTSAPSPGANVILQRLGSVTGANAIVFESDPVIALTV